MSNDKVLGSLILLGSIGGICAYFWLLFFSVWAMLVIQISAFLAVAAVLLILSWIGYTMATTPPPIPLIDQEFEDGVNLSEAEN